MERLTPELKTKLYELMNNVNTQIIQLNNFLLEENLILIQDTYDTYDACDEEKLFKRIERHLYYLSLSDSIYF